MVLKKFAWPAAISWFVIINILFFLPGSAFPKDDWLSKIAFDKWVHIGIFTVLLFLWCHALALKSLKAFVLIILLAVGYGLLVEYIQERWVDNRSFDWGDLIADAIGCVIGVIAWLKIGIKK